MNVLFLTHNYPRHEGDFSGVFLRVLARRLHDEGITVTVLAPHDAGLAEKESINGIEIHRFRYDIDENENFAYRGNMHRRLMTPSGIFTFRRFLSAYRKAGLKIAQGKNFDLIAAHWAVPSAPVANIISKQTDTPLVINSHGTDIRILRKFWLARRFCAKALERASAWTVVSEYLSGLALECYPNYESKISVCPAPIDESVFYREENIPRENDLIVAVTRFTKQKRVNHLISAAGILKDSGTDFKLEIYGTGPEKDNLQTQLESLGLSDFVTFSAPIPQTRLRKVYNRAKATVLNSVGEGFGLTLVEGALCGSVPVGTRSGGIIDIIEDYKSGLLCDPDSPQSLAIALKLALEKNDFTDGIARTASKRAKERFSSEAIGRTYADVYRKAASA